MTADGLEEVDVYFNIIEGDVEPPVEIELDHISASYIGEDLYVGNALENSDILVTAYYINSSEEKEVTNLTISGYSSDTAGIKTVTISYSEDGKTVTTTISIEIKEENIPLIIDGDGGDKPVKNELSLGCSGSVVTSSIFISLLSGFGLVLGLKKKRG